MPINSGFARTKYGKAVVVIWEKDLYGLDCSRKCGQAKSIDQLRKSGQARLGLVSYIVTLLPTHARSQGGFGEFDWTPKI